MIRKVDFAKHTRLSGVNPAQLTKLARVPGAVTSGGAAGCAPAGLEPSDSRPTAWLGVNRRSARCAYDSASHWLESPYRRR